MNSLNINHKPLGLNLKGERLENRVDFGERTPTYF